jgi:hypothetical protein
MARADVDDTAGSAGGRLTGGEKKELAELRRRNRGVFRTVRDEGLRPSPTAGRRRWLAARRRLHGQRADALRPR